jgi:hypothetical protein
MFDLDAIIESVLNGESVESVIDRTIRVEDKRPPHYYVHLGVNPCFRGVGYKMWVLEKRELEEILKRDFWNKEVIWNKQEDSSIKLIKEEYPKSIKHLLNTHRGIKLLNENFELLNSGEVYNSVNLSGDLKTTKFLGAWRGFSESTFGKIPFIHIHNVLDSINKFDGYKILLESLDNLHPKGKVFISVNVRR